MHCYYQFPFTKQSKLVRIWVAYCFKYKHIYLTNYKWKQAIHRKSYWHLNFQALTVEKLCWIWQVLIYSFTKEQQHTQYLHFAISFLQVWPFGKGEKYPRNEPTWHQTQSLQKSEQIPRAELETLQSCFRDLGRLIKTLLKWHLVRHWTILLFFGYTT